MMTPILNNFSHYSPFYEPMGSLYKGTILGCNTLFFAILINHNEIYVIIFKELNKMCAMDDLTTETQNIGIVKGIFGKIFDIPLADRWMLHKSSINPTGCIIYLSGAFIGRDSS